MFDHWKGAPLALLLHVVLAGYFVAVIGLIFVGAWLVDNWRFRDFDSVGYNGLLLACLIALAVICRRCERYVATQCIRRWLNKPPDD